MKTHLTSITQPLIRTEDNTRFLTPEEFIVYCARVSNPNNQLNTESSPRLLKYCIEHEHWSIFEMATMTIEIETSRDISAQIIRHRSFSFQEYSQRYSSVTELETFEIRKQAEKNRQSSSDLLELTKEEVDQIKNHVENCLEFYNNLLKKGAAKECARKFLPLNSKTTLYMTGNVRSWIHYLKLRTKEDTQKEHREIAEAIQKIFIKNFPLISISLGWKNLHEALHENLISLEESKKMQNSSSKDSNPRKHTLLSDPSNESTERYLKFEKKRSENSIYSI